MFQLSVIAMPVAQATEASLPVKKAVKIVELMEPMMVGDEAAVDVEVDALGTATATLLEGKGILPLYAMGFC